MTKRTTDFQTREDKKKNSQKSTKASNKIMNHKAFPQIGILTPEWH